MSENAKLIRDGNDWGVEFHGGRRVLEGESFTIASHITEELNGQPSGAEECREVAAVIRAGTPCVGCGHALTEHHSRVGCLEDACACPIQP